VALIVVSISDSGARQIELHGRPLSDFALEPDMAARLPHEAVDLAKPQTRAVSDILGSKKRFED
jgi:hypothetical protein